MYFLLVSIDAIARVVRITDCILERFGISGLNPFRASKILSLSDNRIGRH
jgi:hypothetical protein